MHLPDEAADRSKPASAAGSPTQMVLSLLRMMITRLLRPLADCAEWDDFRAAVLKIVIVIEFRVDRPRVVVGAGRRGLHQRPAAARERILRRHTCHPVDRPIV